MEGEGGDVPHDETFEEFTARYGSRGSELRPCPRKEMWKRGPEAPA